MNSPLRIGTRDSQLAMWQANRLKKLLEENKMLSELVPVKSEGDLNLEQPLYTMGTVGIFTKTLDQALLANRIDLAIHSMKDVPTQLPKGIKKAAVLKRGVAEDIVVWKSPENANKKQRTLATGSLRRKAQWLHHWPQDRCVPLRGNIQTRLSKLHNSNWDGAIFAAAALERLEISDEFIMPLEEFIPAPAQGALMIVTREENESLCQALNVLNHEETDLCTQIERDFLRTLEGGCTAPIGAHAQIKQGMLHFIGGLYSLQEKKPAILKVSTSLEEANGALFANELLRANGRELILEFKKSHG